MRYIFLILLLSCAKQVELPKVAPRIPLPDLDEEWELDDLPEAEEDEDTGSEE